MGEFIDRAQQVQAGGYKCPLWVVSLQDSGVARYATGTAHGLGGNISADITESFSDRFIELPSEGVFASENPFSSKATDMSTITIDLTAMAATMVLHRWGDATFTFPVRDNGDAFFGVGDAICGNSNQAYFLITLGSPFEIK